MESFEKLFVHRAEYRVIICKRCEFAVNPAQVGGHIRSKHPTVTKAQCGQIIEFINELSHVAYEPEDVIYPDPSSGAVSEIPVYEDGLRCTQVVNGRECNFVCRERSGIQKHCRAVHQWKNPRKKGRPNDDTDPSQIWIDHQPCQEFFKTGKWRKLFPIQVIPVRHPSVTVDVAREAEEWMDTLFQSMEQAQVEAHTARSRYEPNPWLEHTGWERHIPPDCRRGVIECVKGEPSAKRLQEWLGENYEGLVASDEVALGRACEATVVLIRRSFQVSRKEIVGRHALHCINRRENGAPNNDRPFYGKQQIKTIRKYAAVFVKVLRYIWRTAEMTQRPEYRLTKEQQRALTRLRHVAQEYRREREEREAIIQAGETFWVAIFDHELGDDEYENAMLSGLAVLGACGENEGWVSALDYTPTLAGVITTMRAMIIRRAWRGHHDAIKQKKREGATAEAASQEAPIIHQLVQRDVEKFMTMTTFGGQPHPLHTIYTQKMYGLKIRYSTHGNGQVGWTGPDQDVIVMRKVQFSMGQIREVVHGLLDTVRRRLIEELLGWGKYEGAEWKPEGLPSFNISHIVDNQGIIDEGYSFLKDSQNVWSVDGARWMGQRLFTDATIHDRFIQDREAMKFDDDAVERYLRQVQRWKEEMLVLVHMSAGAPARATELVSVQQVNGEKGRSHRGIMIDQGMVAFITSYHKGFSASQSEKHIHRFVPREVGEVVVYYLWLVEPFVRILQSSRGQMTSSPWMWEPAPEEEWGDEEEEWAEGEEEEWREEELPAIPEDDSEEAGRIQQQTVRMVARNCDGYWETNRIRRVMRRECSKRIGVAIGPSDWRQAYPAIHNTYAINSDVVGSLKRVYGDGVSQKGEEGEDEQTRETVRARQSGHSPQMEASIYGRQLQQNPFATMRDQDAFREVSVDWHRFMQFPSSYAVQSVGPDIQRRIKQERDQRQFARWQQMREIDVDRQLRVMYGTQARFRGRQREALEAIVSGHPRIVVVMRTGGGKSLLFMLPAAASRDGVTIVVMPKVMLQEDMAARCRREGIRCAVWSDNRAPPYDAQIVFVIAESAVSQAFADFVNAKMLNEQLERVVIDECHSVLQSTPKFRPKLVQLQELVNRETQVVCLTATLPPRKEAMFMSVMGMEPQEVRMIRESTVRPNIQYSVVRYDGEMETLEQIIRGKLRQYPAQDRIVVYCRTIADMRKYAAAIGGQVFYRGMGDVEEKRGVMALLTEGEERLFWSTSALGEGIDAPTIRVVIHVGGIDKLDDFGQQSGRAGRDGVTRSESIVLQEVRVNQRGETSVVKAQYEEAQMTEYLAGERCRRVVLDQDMDGDEGRPSCRVEEQFCDVCRGEGNKRVRTRQVTVTGEDIGEEPAAKRARTVDITPRRQQEMARERAEALAVERVADAERQRQREEERQAQEKQQIATQEAFQQQRRQREAMQVERRQRTVDQADGVEQIRGLFDEWKRGCNVCRVNGRPVGRKGWRLCPCKKEEEERVINEGMAWLREVRWSNGWTACGMCWAPQAICHTWEPIHDHGPSRFRRKAGKSQCQYRGYLAEAMAIIMYHAGAEMSLWMAEQAEAANVDDTDGMAFRVWLGLDVKDRGVEMSRMVWAFREWAVRYPTVHG